VLNKFNILSYAYLFCISLSFLEWSNFYNYSLSIDFYIFIAGVLLINSFAAILDIKIISKISNFNKNVSSKITRSHTVDFLLIFYFCLNLIYTQTNPLWELVNLRDYKDINNLFGYSLFFLPFCMGRVMFLFETKTSRLDLIFIYLYFFIFISNVSRIILFSMIITLLSYKFLNTLNFKKGLIFKYINIRTISVLLFFGFGFGVLGEIRSSESKSSEQALSQSVSVIRFIGDPSESFDNTGINDNFLWPYLYTVSPLYNLNNALLISANYDENVLLKSILPNFIYQKLGITKDKNFLVIDTFNTSTVNGEFISSFGKGWGLIYYLFICIYVLIFSLLAKVFCNRITEIFIGVFLIFTIFSSVILKEIFVITLLFSFVQGFLSSFQFKLYK